MKLWKLFVILLIPLLTACFNEGKSETPITETPTLESQEQANFGTMDFENPFSFDQLDLEGSDVLGGNKIDSSVFQNSEITMVNVWATFCKPCVDEMPDIAKLHNESTEDVQILGIVIDTLDGSMENQMKAKEILESSQANFLNLTPSIEFAQNHYQDFQSIPTTFFVDREGKVIGPVRLGAGGYQDYKILIEQALSSMEK